MKKKNILDLLASDYLKEHKIKDENFNKCITNFDECIEKYIKPYLLNNQERFNYKFDLKSNDEKTKDKSILLLEFVCRLFRDLISYSPDLFLSAVKEKDYEYACYSICFYVLIGNIKDINNDINNVLNKS